MFGDISKIDKMKKKLNSVSPSFCMAKWMHCTLHLLTGRSHSCYLPPTHKINLDEIKKDPSALHNTSYKKEVRKMMKEGQRPKECSICWDIEDLPEDRYSDRHFRGVDDWTMPYFRKLKKIDPNKNINPSYLEVSWSSVCNFKCMYCSPAVSTEWMKEVKKQGSYKLSTFEHQYIPWFEENGLMPMDEKENPYIDAFWKWWPDLIKDLLYFRITGGEPLLSIHTFRTLEWLKDNKQKKLELSINSNLGINERQFNKFMALLKEILDKKRIKNHILHTSLDTFGPQAEYIRNGLDLEKFKDYTERYLTELPTAGLAFMSTFNNLSVVNYKQFLEWVLYLRRKYNNKHRQVLLDIPHLQGPEFFSAKILTEEFYPYLDECLEFMREHKNEAMGFKEAEIIKLERVYSWMKEGFDEDITKRYQIDFYMFFVEHDKRRGTNFLETFPEMKGFWNKCKLLALAEGIKL